MLERISEITEAQADLIKSFAIYYLIIIANHVDRRLFTCFQLEFIENHKSIQILFSFLLFYFLVTLVSNTGKFELIPPIQKFIYTFFYFMLFLVVMRLDLRIMFIVLFLVFVVYFLELNKDYYVKQGEKVSDPVDQDMFIDYHYWITLDWPWRIRLFPVKKSNIKLINAVENILYYVIIVLLVIGFISYGGEVKQALRKRKDLTWFDVIIDTNICKLKDDKSLWTEFKDGLGLKI